jgi:hypothetical protein
MRRAELTARQRELNRSPPRRRHSRSPPRRLPASPVATVAFGRTVPQGLLLPAAARLAEASSSDASSRSRSARGTTPGASSRPPSFFIGAQAADSATQ